MPMIRSSVSGVDWPGIPDRWGAAIVSMQRQFQDSEWWPPQKIQRHQFRQLRALLTHFEHTSPFYRERMLSLGHPRASDLSPENFEELPLTSRAEVQTAGDAYFSEAPPPDHGRIYDYPTSGSCGLPLTARYTEYQRTMHEALYVRNDNWRKRDFTRKFALIQCFRKRDFAGAPYGRLEASWAQPYHTGPFALLNCETCALSDQLDWLMQQKPAYLFSYPSNLSALAQSCLENGVEMPWLEQISTFAEPITELQRERFRQAWAVPVSDTYGAAECSMIAFQCPDHDHMLVQAENVIVEVLDHNEVPCKPGETGRVVVTALHNFVMPVIRYVLGDLVEVGEPCSTGRGLPVIKSIRGRIRNMIRLPGGKRAFPLRWTKDISRMAPVRQYQVIQTSLSEMEVKLAVVRALTPREEADLMAAIQEQLGHPFHLKPVYVTELSHPGDGKFEEFRCEIDEVT